MDIIKSVKTTTGGNLPEDLRKKIIRNNLPGFKLNQDDLIFRPAETLDDYIKSFRLVHDVYVESGYIDPSPTALRLVPQHSNPETKVFLGCTNCNNVRTPVYTVSLFPDSAAGLPMDNCFKKEIDRLRNIGRRVAEVGCLASNPDFRKQDMNIPMLGNRIVHQYATRYLNIDDLVITVHPKYRWVYEDVLLFEKLGSVSEYAYVKNHPAIAMRINLHDMEEKYKRIYSNFPLPKNLHRFFFEEECVSIDISCGDQEFCDLKLIKKLLLYHSFSGMVN